MNPRTSTLIPTVLTFLAAGCSSGSEGQGTPSGGGGGAGGTQAGAAGSQAGGPKTTNGGAGGAVSTGGAGAGGTIGTGGAAGAGGTGGTVATGGMGGGGMAGGGMAGSGGVPGDIWGGLENPPRKSDGCDKPATITNGTKMITSGGVQRSFIVDIPDDYDPAKPYRLFYVSHGLGGSAQGVAGSFFGLKPEATNANDPAIFVAGQGLPNSNGMPTWGQTDHVFFDDVTNLVKDGLCVDTTRVFVTGMSMGGMYSYSLSTDRQKSIRAGVGIAPTNFNIWLPNPKLTDPIAWMQTTGDEDEYCPWVTDEADKRGSKFIALEKATDNGCMIPTTVPFWESGNHICYDFVGCKPGYPVKACSFDGGHVDSNRDPGSNTNWIAKESWEFFTQF